MRAIRAQVEGRVQGVGFRYYTARVAMALELAGWVRNLDDGSVEVWAQGPDGAIAEIVAFLEVGPAGASVTRCLVEDAPADSAYESFEVRF